MKFGKEFTAQMVPEWHEAYMDYNHLKKILKDILISKQKHSESITTVDLSHSSLKRKIHLYRAFSGLTTWNRSNLTRSSDEEAAVLFAAADGEAEAHVPAFFTGIEGELRKVARFYSSKVEDVVAEADELSRQMDVLIALRVKIENPEASLGKFNNPDREQGEVKHMDAIREIEMNRKGVVRDEEEEEEDDDDDDDDEEQGINPVREVSDQSGSSSGNEVEGAMISPIVILDSVKINKGHETPISALKRKMVQAYSSSEFNKDQLKQSEELMAKAFVEFYQKLRLLKSYRFMNRLAFSKIMKKYDKITKRSASKTILDMVDRTDLGSCEKVTKLMERVEAAFIKHFWNGDREKGMNILRPKRRREKHTITFFLGCLFGCSLALVVTIAVLIHVRGIVDSQGRSTYMENIFPLYSLFGYIILHMLLFGGNIYFWKRYRINYPFIFGLKEGTVLEYREVFLLSAGLSVLSLAAVTSNLNMDMDRKTNHFKTLPELVPLILVSVIFVILFCPLNIIYRSTRYFLLTSTLHCLLAPLYKVTLPDFFLADQLTSQFQAIRSLEFYVCYYIRGNFRKRDSRKCLDSTVYEAFYIIAAAFPFWIRFLQCVRRLVGERDRMHTYNALKYFSIIVAVCTRTLYEQKKGSLLLVIAATTSVGATTFATWWDIALDWGLLQRKSRNPWLRDKLVIRSKTVYFAAIVLNCLLRFAWMQTVLGFTETPFLHKNAFVAIFASLEVIRRGVWNFFRLENEHLNNVGKYRAFKSVPLPFNYENGDKDS